MTEQEEIDEMREEINLTTNLFYKTYNEEKDALFYLLDEDYKDILDKRYYAVLSYKLYECYLKEDFKRQILDNDVWEDYNKTTERGYKSKYRLFNNKNGMILSGEVLNSTSGIIKRYIDDINKVNSEDNIENLYWETMHYSYCELKGIDVFRYKHGQKTVKAYKKAKENREDVEKCKNCLGQISSLAKMFFHLATTIGNVMPWPLNYNYRSINKELDIVQTKYQYYIGLYGKVDNTGIDKESWIKAFVEGHYLQDFVTDDMTRATEFLNLDKVCKQKDDSLQNWVVNILNKKNDSPEDDIEQEWNLYFYRCSKAIMKRSYRILKTEEIKEGKLSEEQKEEFEGKFREFCNECGVKDDLKDLKDYLSDDKHKGRIIKDNELEELEKLIKELK